MNVLTRLVQREELERRDVYLVLIDFLAREVLEPFDVMRQRLESVSKRWDGRDLNQITDRVTAAPRIPSLLYQYLPTLSLPTHSFLLPHTYTYAMSARTDTEATQNQLSSGITADSLAETIRSRLDAAHVDIQDLSGG